MKTISRKKWSASHKNIHRKNRTFVTETSVLKNKQNERQRQYDKRSLRRNRSLCPKIRSKREIQTKLRGGKQIFLEKNTGGVEDKEVTGVIPEEEQQNFLKNREITKHVSRTAS